MTPGLQSPGASPAIAKSQKSYALLELFRSYWMMCLLLVISGLVLFGFALNYAYDLGIQRGLKMAPPLIRAELEPTKIAPEQPGGMDIPHQDKIIFEGIISNELEVGKGELLPPPEEPNAKPMPEKSEASDLISPLGEVEGGENQMVTSVPIEQLNNLTEKVSSLTEATIEAIVSTEKVSAEINGVNGKQSLMTNKSSEEKGKKIEVTDSVLPYVINPKNPMIQLAAYRSIDGAESGWKKLLLMHPDLLGGLAYRVVRIDLGAKKGTFFRLQVGPLRDEASAHKLCKEFINREQGCILVKS